ncbi:hypothetical protein SD71_06645 [Cohnella kolymensis]|uniref:Spore protein n=1 Tax=Cohnella kolymensis TaxID=1590652 RepID=A0ABR5A6G9_9BACL|nr:alpha/beta-type small acid-soluble spore protein [Cohnella kolymensis]KIL36675.1 hypothetical protein SD71_06645 [Cohnella kolymensis]
MPRRRRQLVPEARPMLDLMKYEIAAELGMPIAQAGFDAEFAGELGGSGGSGRSGPYMGFLTARETGALGGGIVKRLLVQAEAETAQVLR